jgi:hypothetical protein
MSLPTNKILTGLTNDIPYSFRVAGVNAVGTGDYSPVVSGVPYSGGFTTDFTAASWNSAAQLKSLAPSVPNGVYTINNQPTYCIMDSSVDGGSWMLAMKATRGTTFNYNADYWTINNTLNTSSPDRTDSDAKYHIFNSFVGSEVIAIWPDLNVTGGSFNAPSYGWIWKYTMPTPSTLLNLFQNTVDLGNPSNFNGYNSSVWSDQQGYRRYGINIQAASGGQNGVSGPGTANVRWGFAWNNEGDANSNDVSGGIGMAFGVNYSAGDAYGCCGNSRYNRSMRVEIYIR